MKIFETISTSCHVAECRTDFCADSQATFQNVYLRFFSRRMLRAWYGPVWTRFLILETRFSLIYGPDDHFLILGTRFSILKKRLKKTGLTVHGTRALQTIIAINMTRRAGHCAVEC